MYIFMCGVLVYLVYKSSIYVTIVLCVFEEINMKLF
jgi:hypothetical protein